MKNSHSSNLLQVEAPRRVSGILLWVSAGALIVCSFIAASAYIYSILTTSVSEHRRHLNAGAYRAQLFLDQREALLRAIAATAVRGEKLSTQSDQAGDAVPRLHAITLPENEGDSEWQLAVTPRMLSGLALANARLMHISVSPASSHVLEYGADGGAVWRLLPDDHISAVVGLMSLPDQALHPVTWLHRSGGDSSTLTAWAPIDRKDVSKGLVGLELNNLQQVLQLPDVLGSSYTLLDSQGSVVLRSADAPAYLAGLQDDYFGLRNESRLPHDIALSKSIGSGGLRVVYSVPVQQLLADANGALLRTLVLEVLFIVLVVSAAYAARRILLLPAQRQYRTLLDSVELNRTLIATAPVGLALVSNADGVVLRENALARRWMDHDAQWRDRIASVDGNTVLASVDLDDRRHVQITSVPLVYRGEAVSLCVVSDVTQQKQTEASLKTARTIAESASQAKTQFLATMSHDIRTPLFGITGTLELLSATVRNANQKRFIELLHRSAAALVRTVNDSLDISRIESGQMVLEKSDFCLLALIDEVIASFIARAEGKGLRLYAVADLPSIGDVAGDPQHIRQILDNLVSNAIKFTDAGQVVLRVKAFTRADGLLQLLFQVSDTGIGVAPESINHLFEPYYRADEALARKVPGTGLGLAISNRLAVLMGGSMHAVSKPGLGTRVSFEVALAKAVGPLRHPQLQGKPVYVAGQSFEVVSNLCRWLSRWGALAVPCTGAMQQMDSDAVLLHAWPPALEAPTGHARQVFLRPASANLDADAARGLVSAPAHALLDIGWAVLRAQQGRGADPADIPVGAEVAALGKRVMVVDDSPISQLVVKAQLDMLGCDVVLADSGQRALLRVDLHDFDAILTDLNMPSMSGFDLAEALRKKGYLGLILGTSADALPDSHGKSWSSGMDAMLVKPLFLSTLREHLRAARRYENKVHVP